MNELRWTDIHDRRRVGRSLLAGRVNDCNGEGDEKNSPRQIAPDFFPAMSHHIRVVRKMSSLENSGISGGKGSKGL